MNENGKPGIIFLEKWKFLYMLKWIFKTVGERCTIQDMLLVQMCRRLNEIQYLLLSS